MGISCSTSWTSTSISFGVSLPWPPDFPTSSGRCFAPSLDADQSRAKFATGFVKSSLTERMDLSYSVT